MFNNPIPIERMLGNIAGMTMTHNFPLFASTLCQIDTQQQVGRAVNQRKTSPVLNTETISLSPTQSAQTVTCSKIPPTNENLQHMSLPSPLMTVSQPHQPTNSSSKPSVTTQDITTHTNTSPPSSNILLAAINYHIKGQQGMSNDEAVQILKSKFMLSFSGYTAFLFLL